MESIIIISPIGSQDPCILSLVRREIGNLFGYKTEIIPLLENIDFAIDVDRNQYYSTKVLERLAEKAPPNTIKVLAITANDLFIPILTHVFGEAQLGGKASIISTYRLTKDLPSMDVNKALEKRIVKESIHELGHTFKLRHCKDNHCIMHYSRSLNDVDQKSNQFCRYCRRLLDDEVERISSMDQ
jgi:archaemetzincin